MDKSGRIMIPKAMREHLGLKPGMRLEIHREGDGIRIRRQAEKPAVVVRDGVTVFTGIAIGDVADAVVEAHRRRRLSSERGR